MLLDLLRALDAFGRHLERPGEDERQRESEQHEHDDERDAPRRDAEPRHSEVGDLEHQPANDRIQHGDPHDVAAPELPDERLHAAIVCAGTNRGWPLNGIGGSDQTAINLEASRRARISASRPGSTLKELVGTITPRRRASCIRTISPGLDGAQSCRDARRAPERSPVHRAAAPEHGALPALRRFARPCSGAFARAAGETRASRAPAHPRSQSAPSRTSRRAPPSRIVQG